jgi:hypothetical protein
MKRLLLSTVVAAGLIGCNEPDPPAQSAMVDPPLEPQPPPPSREA